jgi:hypothetical protein
MRFFKSGLKSLLVWFTLCLGCIGARALELVSISPVVLYKDFSQEVVTEGPHLVRTTPTNHSIAMMTERVYPHDRLPMSTSRCIKAAGEVVRMVDMQEEYNVACCVRLNRTAHSCPRLPTGKGNLVYSILLFESRPVYFSPVGKGVNNWTKTSLYTTYAYHDRMEGVVRMLLGTIVLAVMVLCGLHMLVGGAHKWSNENPTLCITVHVVWSVCMAWLLFVIMQETEDDLFKAGLVHTIIQILFSLVLVYIPSDGFHTVDQRLEVSARSFVSEIANNSLLKWFTVHVFALATVLNALSMHTVFNILCNP